MGSTYLHRVIRDKPDVDSVLEKEEPIGVGTEFIRNPIVTSGLLVPKILFYYSHPTNRRILVRPMVGADLTVVAEGFAAEGVTQMTVDRTNKIVFFSIGSAMSSPWTSLSIYKFSYDEDTGLPTSSIDLIYTAISAITALYAEPVTQKLYFNGDLGATALSRMNYDGSSEESVSAALGDPWGVWIAPGGTDIYVANSGATAQIKLIDISGGIPGSITVWYQEDSPAFGASTWYKWRKIIVDSESGVAIMEAQTSGFLHLVSWPTPPATPTSHPPAYSTNIYEETFGTMNSWDLDVINKYLFVHNSNNEVTWRYYYGNNLMENETLIVNLSLSAISPPVGSGIKMLHLG